MFQRNIQGVVIGALLGTVIGSLSAVLAPKRQVLLKKIKNQARGWVENSKDRAKNIYENSETSPKEVAAKNFIKGAVTGALAGAGSALLFTPKTGKQLRKELMQKYEQASETTNDVIELFNSTNHQSRKHPQTKRKSKSKARIKTKI
jgi:gas vesicle protein